MNHFMLSDSTGAPVMADRGRYGTTAMTLLVDTMIHRGAHRHALEAKVFGGGIVMGDDHPTMDVGKHNAEFVLDDLEAKGIAVTATDLRGLCARKVYFIQHSGDVHVRYVQDERLAKSR